MNLPAAAADAIDQTFRKLFREELPQRVAALEGELRQLVGGAGEEAFAAFYRGVHNIKGNASSFGFHALVGICHRLEDLLKYTEPQARVADPEFRRACLALLDLMVDAMSDDDDVLERIQAALAQLKTGCERRPRRALLVGDSRATVGLCHGVLAERGYEVVVVRDGYLALHRALTEPFDVLVTTGQTQFLKGEALIAALRLSDTANRDLLTVVLTSAVQAPRKHKRNTDPDRILARNASLVQELQAALDEVKG